VANPTSSTGTVLTTGGSPCSSAHLSVAVGQTYGAGGTDEFPLVFTNTGAVACTLRGYPGVSFVGANGNQVAFSAERKGSGQGPLVSMAPGQTATALAFVPEPADSSCSNPVAVRFKLYPPNQTVALFAPVSGLSICESAPKNTLSIYPFGVQSTIAANQ
jgi:hypothetical protein